MDEYGDQSLAPPGLLKSVKRLTEAKRLWIAYSGGLDSHVLLHLAYQTFSVLSDYSIGAIHVHHGLSEFADDWVIHCEKTCAALNIPFTVLWVKVENPKGQSLEEVAREARYEAWSQFLQPQDCLLVAHHEDDQAETILLRLFRGAGPQGLSGMLEKVNLGEGGLIRPLLSVSKASILDYAKAFDLHWIEDDSNVNLRFDRNYLRQEILPKIRARWPRVVRSVNRSGSLCLETKTAVQVLAAEDFKQVAGLHALELSVPKLLAMDPHRRKGVIRYWIQSLKLPVPSRDQLERIEREILHSRRDRKPLLKIGEYEVKRVLDKIYCEIA